MSKNAHHQIFAEDMTDEKMKFAIRITEEAFDMATSPTGSKVFSHLANFIRESPPRVTTTTNEVDRPLAHIARLCVGVCVRV